MNLLETVAKQQNLESILEPLHAVTPASLLRTVVVGTAGASWYNSSAVGFDVPLMKGDILGSGHTSIADLMAGLVGECV